MFYHPQHLELLGAEPVKKMLESRSEDALVLLVKLVKSTVETVETVESVETVETVETEKPEDLKKSIYYKTYLLTDSLTT